MLAQRLASRTVISSERVCPHPRHPPLGTPYRFKLTSPLTLSQDVGTQTSLSFETSSSIRNELLLYLEEQGMLDEQEQEDGSGKDKDSNADGTSYVRGVGEMTVEELRAVSTHIFLV